MKQKDKLILLLLKIKDTWRKDNDDATSAPYLALNKEFDEIMSQLKAKGEEKQEICNHRMNGADCLFFAFRKCTDVPCSFPRRCL